MFLIRTKPSPVFVFIIAIALIFVFGAVNFSHFFKLYTVAAISSILLAAFIPLAFNLFIPVKFISVPHTRSIPIVIGTAAFAFHHFGFYCLLSCFGPFHMGLQKYFLPTYRKQKNNQPYSG